MRQTFEDDEQKPTVAGPEQTQIASPNTGLSLRRRAHLLCLFILLCLILISIAAPSCVILGCTAGVPGCDDGWVPGARVANPHFELVLPSPSPSPSPSLKPLPSKDFWVKDGEQIRVAWDSYDYLFHKPDIDPPCDFTAATLDRQHCRICRQCAPKNDRTECGFVFAYDETQGDVKPALLTFSQFMLQSAPTHTDILDPTAACGDGFLTTPAENVTLQLKALGSDEFPILQTKVFVFSQGPGQTVTYALEPLEQTAVGVTYFKGTIPPFELPNAPGLEDTFSPHLHITQVRVLKVPTQVFPVKGKPANGAIEVRPSRLVFIPNYLEGNSVNSQDNIRCYAKKTMNGDLDLTHCRGAYADPRENSLIATPAYLDSDPGKLLTWVAEFNESEDAEMLSLLAGEMLVIEFTIVVT